MIRLAAYSDIGSIISLWNEAFGDSENEILFFLNRKFVPENTVVFDDNGRIVSMLFLLEGDLTLNNVSYPSYYLYAACTAKSHRGNGLMGMILDYARTVACERDKYFICLKPANKLLFSFYEKYGYKTVFSSKILTIENSAAKNVFGFPISKLNDYEKSRKTALNKYNRFDWDESAIRFAEEQHQFYGGNSLKNRNGYLLYSENEHNVYVKEYALRPDFLSESASHLFYCTEKESIIFNLPPDFPDNNHKFVIEESGMALAVKDEYCKILEGIKNAYLGLTLD